MNELTSPFISEVKEVLQNVRRNVAHQASNELLATYWKYWTHHHQACQKTKKEV